MQNGPVKRQLVTVFKSGMGFFKNVSTIWERRANLGGLELVNGVELYSYMITFDVSKLFC